MNRLTLINRSSAARVVILLVVIALYGSLFGCAATQVALSKRNLDVQTRTSTAIFVDPVARSKRTIYLQVRSGVMEFDRRAFKRFIKEQFAANEAGYRIVDNPNKAHFIMSVYVLNLEKTSPTAAQAALHKGFVGDVAAGAVAGAVAGDSWVHDPDKGGGRVLGEMCHFVDLARFFVGQPIR